MTYLPIQLTTIFQGERLHIEIDVMNECVKINGLEFAPEFFEALVNPNTESFYRLSKQEDLSPTIFREFGVIAEKADGEFIIKAK